ncbi:DJ-1/PfpI family protein [Mangrovimonas sp. YM274]|uniref:DJ-1/PfpI family protein n=1 Tax=Mangrovimonas sp. YM274 TaxID=3070660 RepID=UPI0027DB352A|nr:DJ-1/PfpI family protein [Mangrovimonas sp. YM274]WMI67772.1 DJ-1/PfpI family protein [Mangrovimonas sp. YM274]
MSCIKQIFGVAPYEESPNVYSPSNLALKLAVDTKTDYAPYNFEKRNQDASKKILIVGTETELLKMANGKLFHTGNHPFELFIPMLHWESAGFAIDIATPTGGELALEHWAMPTDDLAVMELYESYKTRLETPLNLWELVRQLDDSSPYVAVYFPGGHGAVGDLPFSSAVAKLVNWTAAHNKYMISICHGPSAFLATGEPSPYEGYNISACPDGMDKLLPATGYLPGAMPWFFGERLNRLGIKVVNKTMNGKVIVDRKLITGDGPKAANELGIITSKALLNEA